MLACFAGIQIPDPIAKRLRGYQLDYQGDQPYAENICQSTPSNALQLWGVNSPLEIPSLVRNTSHDTIYHDCIAAPSVVRQAMAGAAVPASDQSALQQRPYCCETALDHLLPSNRRSMSGDGKPRSTQSPMFHTMKCARNMLCSFCTIGDIA